MGNKFEVEFEEGTTEHAAVLDASGKVLMLKQEIALTELPAAVSNTLKQTHKGYDLDEAEKIDHNGTTYYEVELSRFFFSKEVVVSADGKEAKLPF